MHVSAPFTIKDEKKILSNPPDLINVEIIILFDCLLKQNIKIYSYQNPNNTIIFLANTNNFV